jgi:hypothetical protein
MPKTEPVSHKIVSGYLKQPKKKTQKELAEEEENLLNQKLGL